MASLLRSSHRGLVSSSSYLHRFFSASASSASPPPIDVRKLPANYDPATFDPSAPSTPPSDRVWRLVDEVASLTLVEVSQLSSLLTTRLGITEPPSVCIVNAGGGGGGGGTGGAATGAAAGAKEEKKAEKIVFELRLDSFDAASKIKVIKEVRGFTDLGLKEAKELVEKAPAVIKRGVSKEEAEQIIEKMKAVGAKVAME
ncbi:50S ribosomal protein L7/L12 [Rhynchospora pubera]|uniref:50S ribosomal protein L7/L12 n=1 Tax=Rhynchospora pubera TaxID=906938 RepID=A0AAV8HVK1_9POAL|nr:50S ribosomal protein L7/L12 [Rhynchospora pubera]